MNKEELNNWIKSAKFIDSDYEYDSCGNKYGFRIYEKNNQLYRVNYCNNHPSEKWGEKGYIRGEYEVKAVRKKIKTRTITETIYE